MGCWAGSDVRKAADPAALPGGLDRAGVVGAAHSGDRTSWRNPVEDRQARQGGAGASPAPTAGALHPLGLRALLGLDQRLVRVGLVGGRRKSPHRTHRTHREGQGTSGGRRPAR